MNSKNVKFFLALDEIEKQKKISKEAFLEVFEIALATAYKKQAAEARHVRVKANMEAQTLRAYAYKIVVEEVEDEEREISLADARLLKKSYKVGDFVSEEINPRAFGRIAAQTARQVLMQRMQQIEKDIAYSEITEKEGELITVVVRRIEADNVYVDMGKLEAVMLPKDQIPEEKYEVNDRIKVYVKKIRDGQRGPQILVSRSSPLFVKRLFEIEVPEIAAGLVQIKGVVREAGYRTKIAVYCEDRSVDPVGACVGNRGIRVNSIVSELGGEKIDIIPWNPNALEFIANSLSPAKVIIVEVNDDDNTAKVVVPDDKLSLAIGKNGQNARLAARLTGFKIDVKSYSASLAASELGNDEYSNDYIDIDKNLSPQDQFAELTEEQIEDDLTPVEADSLDLDEDFGELED